MSRVGGPIVDRSGSVENSICPRDCSARILPTTSTKTRPLAIRFAQAFYCPLDGRVCSGKSDRLLGKELFCRGDLRTQNGILRQDSLVAHCRFSPIAVEPRSTLLQDRPVRARAGWLRLSYERRDSASPGVSRGNIFFLVPSRNLGCQAVITMALLFSRPPEEVEEGQHAENYGCGSCDRCLRRISGISLRRYRNCAAAISRTGEFLPRR